MQTKKPVNNLALLRVEHQINFIPTLVESANIFMRDIVPNETVNTVGWERDNESVRDFSCRFFLVFILFPTIFMIQFEI